MKHVDSITNSIGKSINTVEQKIKRVQLNNRSVCQNDWMWLEGTIFLQNE